MAAYFVDIDGTLVSWGSSTPLPGAVEQLGAAYRKGHQIIFTTQRPEVTAEFDNKAIRRLIDSFAPGSLIIWGVTSPRIVINDQGAIAINHPQNAPWVTPLPV